MNARFILGRTTWLLGFPLALLVLPVAAFERGTIRHSRPDLNLVAQAGAAIPAEIQALAAKARELHGRHEPQQALAQMEKVMDWATANLTTADPFRASIQAWIGLLLSANGRHQEALAPTDEAVSVYRGLAKTNPAYFPPLALGLTSLSSYYSELSRSQEALSPAEEAVAIMRSLAKTNPTFRESLPLALTNLGSIYSNLGRHQEALVPAQEALKVYEELVKTNPALREKLALASDNLGSIQHKLGNPQGQSHAEAAVKRYEELAKTNPAHLGDLAHARINLGAHYSKTGRALEALSLTEAGVQSYRELATIDPGARDDLARALYNLGAYYFNQDRTKEALASTEEAIKIYRELAQVNPAYLNNLVMAINNLGFIQQQLGQVKTARGTYEESLTITRSLATRDPVLSRIQQRSQNNLEDLNRHEGIRSGTQKVIAATDASYLPQSDPFTPLKRAVVRLWPTFLGANLGMGTIGTGFVVRRQGVRAWIATALHVVTDLDSGAPAKTVEAELYTGTLPAGRVPPRLEVVMRRLPEGIDQPILLEVRGLPPDIQPLHLAPSQPQGTLTVVGHPSNRDPWTVVAYPLMKITEKALLLDGGLESGASGSPVLSGSRQVVGVVYDSPTVSGGRPIPMVWAFPIKALAETMNK